LSHLSHLSYHITPILGHFTEFMNQLSVGDAIIITHPNT
jgi:hypothetical protein